MTKQLSYETYQQTFQSLMQDVTTTADEVVAIWPYVEAIPIEELGSYTAGDVSYVYRCPDSLLEHMLVATNDENVFLVIIIDLTAIEIAGHYLLNLIDLYSFNG